MNRMGMGRYGKDEGLRERSYLLEKMEYDNAVQVRARYVA